MHFDVHAHVHMYDSIILKQVLNILIMHIPSLQGSLEAWATDDLQK